MDGLTEMESKEAHTYTFHCNPTQQIHNFESLLFLPCTFNLCYRNEFVIDTQTCPRIGSSITGYAPCSFLY